MCTTVIVGEKASADGSFLLARSADSNALKAQHFIIHEAADREPGAMYRTKDHAGATAFEWPLPQHTMRYTTVPNFKTGLHGACGFNEAGVGVSGTESIFARDDALAVDPYNTESGITEDDIADIVLMQAKSAREGCALLGRIIEEVGAGEGFGVGFIDDHDSWYLETGTGHQWMAVRTPADKYLASANQGRLKEYVPGRADMMGSKTLMEFAEKNGFWKPAEGPFDFAAAYTRDDGRDRIYNDPRVWAIQKRFNPSLEQKPDEGRSFPVFLAPEKKITPQDLMAVMRDHYEGTPHDPYAGSKLRGDEPWRPVSVFRTYEAHVLQVRPGLPRELGCVLFMAFGMADLSVFVPYYQGLDEQPLNYRLGNAECDPLSAYWKYRRLQTLVMTNYDALAPRVKEAFADFEKRTEIRRRAMEAEYLEVVKTDAKEAHRILNQFNQRVIAEAQALAEWLTDETVTKMTELVQDRVYFKNNKNKD
jgi:dipeptidase